MLTANDRKTLGKLLGKIGSPNDTEVLTAARKADKLVTKRRETWADLLMPASSPVLPPPEHLHEAVDLLRRGKSYLSHWEVDFLRGIMSFRILRPAQAETLASLRAKVNAALEIDQWTD